MELGISPIITASMLLAIFSNTGILNIDKSNYEDRKRYESLSKLFSVGLIFVESIGLVLGGQYGS